MEGGAEHRVEASDCIVVEGQSNLVGHPQALQADIVTGAVLRCVPLRLVVVVDEVQGDEPPSDVVVTDLFDLGHPPGGDPRPRADGVEEEIEFWIGHISTLSAPPAGGTERAARTERDQIRGISRSSKVSMRSPLLRSWKSLRPIPHSKPSRTSRASSLKRLRDWMLPFQMMTPSRRKRTFEPRVMVPDRT